MWLSFGWSPIHLSWKVYQWQQRLVINPDPSSLNFSILFIVQENTRPLVFPPAPLRNLRHLALDARYRSSPSPSPAILTAILVNIKFSSPPLTSFIIKLPERKVVVGEAFITQLLENHSHSLRKLAFLDCGVTHASIAEICKSCLHLQRLDAAIIMKEIVRSSRPYIIPHSPAP